MLDEVRDAVVERAQGALLGQLAGDALGGLVEFQGPEEIRKRYPDGVRRLADGGTWDTIAGQPTDDSEMALALARLLVEKGDYDAGAAREAYVSWLDSGPFDCGGTIACGLRGSPNPESQANGALMRVSPLGLFAAGRPSEQAAEWARLDAEITHPHPVCVQANRLFVRAVADAVENGPSPEGLYGKVRDWAREDAPDLTGLIADAEETPPADFVHQQGWVRIAFQNALWQLLHAPNFEAGVVDTVMRGGDTDTNAAICGALLGAVHGRFAVPGQWVRCLTECRPRAGAPGVRRPRPERYWPADALELARRLVEAGASGAA